MALLVAGEPPSASSGTAVALGVGRPVAGLADAPQSHREALLALGVIAALPQLGPVARFDALGPYALLAPLALLPPDAAPLPAALSALARATDGAELLSTLRAVLDAGDDVAGAAAALHVHRSTLHRRLRRVAELRGATWATAPRGWCSTRGWCSPSAAPTKALAAIWAAVRRSTATRRL